MNIIVIGATATGFSSPAIGWGAAAYASAGRRLRRAVSDRKEAFEQRLQELVLELLAAVVLMTIFMIVTDPATREDDAGVPS